MHYASGGDDDDDDDDDDDELLLQYVCMTESIKLLSYFQPGPLPEVLIIANLQHAASRT